MKLYHFTSHIHLPFILKNGITRGDIVTRGNSFNHPALTTNKDFRMQYWTRNAIIDKTAVRITIDLATDELIKYNNFQADMDGDMEWAEEVKQNYGNTYEWWLAKNPISPDRFIKVKVLKKQKSINNTILKGTLEQMTQMRTPFIRERVIRGKW